MFYRIDVDDRLVELSPDWDEFALANGGVRACRDAVIGRPLSDFLRGDPTRMFVFAAVEAARLTRRVCVLPYRCDGPDERRRFEMVLQAGDDGGVTVEHRLLWRDARGPRALPPRRSRVAGWQCSQCLAMRAAGASEWNGADTAPLQVLGYDVCPACAGRLFAPPEQGTDVASGAADGRR